MDNIRSGLGRVGYTLKLCRYIEGLWKYIVVSILCNLLFKLTPIAISLLTSYMISIAIMGNTHHIWQMFIWVSLLVVLSGLFSYLDVLVSHDTTYKILTKLRNAAYDKIDAIAPAALEGRHSGELTSIVLEDIEQLEWFYAHTLGQIIVAVLISLAALIAMGLISPLLPLGLIPFVIVLICVPVRAAKKANAQGYVMRENFSILNARIVDGVQGLKDIISFQWQRQFFQRFTQSVRDYHRAQLAYALRGGDENRLFQMIIGVGSLCGQILAVLLVMQGAADMVWLLPVFILCSVFFGPLQDALLTSINYGMIFGSAKRLFELFQMESTVEDKGEASAFQVMGTEKGQQGDITLALESVSFTYPAQDGETANQVLFRDISFSVGKGETVALVGASGSGKTTIARLLQRFWDVDGGRITMNGHDIRTLRLEALREIITVVPQEVYLFNASVMDNLLLAKHDAAPEEVKEALKKSLAEGFIQKLPQGWHTVLGERGTRLSGGEKQRLAIAQAFLKDSPLLILDEASANLDSETERQLNKAINNLKKGRATIVIAHRASTIRSADRIVVIKDGQIEGTGTYEQLVANCPYFVQLLGGDYAEQTDSA
ncbi:ABC transporter ATP-binding protein [Desulfitobacterium chlororespirans]|uniref:ATP-binding cassette, subfamily B n=1 Tax=Desulfitobacterium chlororespirans DSM 11544 TaxID=1121395 RepID=A0A1M7UKC0_9FIRM|nr:ABC transporter ATP-binding protein [Desulfitobacterium chlororespirans]SHN83472.1 ATP-binding cassette, subfamily B [Desulfitobacterium chlororespirans DSM 11544]